MPGVARVGVDTINSGPPVVIQGTLQTTVKIAGVNVAIVGDNITPHPGGGLHSSSKISAGNTKVKLAGIDIARNTDPTLCGHNINTGAPKVIA